MSLKISFKNSRNLTLIGTLWEAQSNAIVVMAHGSGSNRFSRGLFEQIARALQQQQYNILAFDFSGHGESDDDIFNTQKSIDDLNAALDYVKAQGYQHIALFGHSFGSLSCLKAFSPDIKTMVLLGSLMGPVKWRWEEHYTPEQLQQIKNNRYITSEVNDGLRAIIKTDLAIFDEILAIDQNQLLSNVTCPVLIMHGDADQDELDLFDFARKGLPLLRDGSELVIIHGASHLFLDHVKQVISLTKTWLHDNFPPTN